MAKKHNIKKDKEPQYRQSTMPGFLVSLYLILMFSVFPLFLVNRYGSARTDKFWFYLVLSGMMIFAVVVTVLTDYFEEKRIHKASLRFMPLSVADIAFLCFYGFAAISTMVSDYTKQAFFGRFVNDRGMEIGGRNNGLILLTVYLLVYLIVTRRYVFKNYVIAVYLVFSSFVAFLAVANFFFIDILGIYSGYVDLWKLFEGKAVKLNAIVNFGSTLGNKNLIASFMCLFLPIAVMSFVLIEKRWMQVISGVAICFAYGGLLCADSGSGILGLVVILAVMAIFSARRYDSLKRYMLALAILFAAGKSVRLFSFIMDDRSKSIESVNRFLLYGKIMYLPIVLFVVLYILMRIFEKKLAPRYPKKAVTITLIVLSAGGILAAIGAFVYFSFVNPDAPLGKNLSQLLRFDERWGTHRGYFWIHGMEKYRDFSFIHKLFGNGPDTAYIVMEPFFPDMVVKFDEGSTDCVHNEFLNYLITQGALGLISYLTLLGAVAVRAIKCAKHDPVVLIFLSAVICYAVQSVVNLYQPITTPIFFLFLSMTEALNRREISGSPSK